MSQMICSSAAGDPNTLYYVSSKAENRIITQVLVEQKALDLETSSENDLGRRLVVLRTNRGDYQCEEPLDGFTIALMLRCFGTSIAGVIEDRLKAIAQTIDTDFDRYWERFQYIQSVWSKAYLSRHYQVTPLSQPGTRAVANNVGQVAVTQPTIAESIRTSPAKVDVALPSQSMAARNYPKRETKPVDRYKPRSRLTPKKEILK